MDGKGHQEGIIDLVAIRHRLKTSDGRRHWRSLQELSGTPEFQELLHHEFPPTSTTPSGSVSRRDALKLMGASAALAGLTACTKLPTEKIVPYVRSPEELIPGKPLFYATAMPFRGVAAGLLVESHMGRPTKVEGNPTHPTSLGATDIFAQASALTLYDPDRSQVLIHEGRIASWGSFLAALNNALDEQRPARGAGLRILTETVTSPTLASQLRELLAKFPKAQWHQFEPTARDAALEGARLAFGEPINTTYRFDRAEVILALDADFLNSLPGSVRYAREFADKRRITGPQSTMNRLYAVESALSVTGAMADHRLPLKPTEVIHFARAIAEGLGVKTGLAGPTASANVPAGWIQALLRDLQNHRGSSLVLAGDEQPPVVHALAHWINRELGNAGETVVYTAPIEANPVNQRQSLAQLVSDINAGQVDVLLILGGNPVYFSPADLEFARNLMRVRLRVHLGLYEDETAELCHWHVPEAHFLEAWGDARAYDGTVSIIQPLIAPLYSGKSTLEVVAAVLGQPDRSGHDIVRDYWKTQLQSTKRSVSSDKEFERLWETSLNDGLIAGTALPPRKVSLRPAIDPQAFKLAAEPQTSTSTEDLEIVFRPDPTVWDGRFSNNGWLQELPKPFTKLTWDNVALLSPATAERLGLAPEDLVQLEFRGRSVDAPVWVLPGHGDNCVTVHLGYGRSRAGGVGTGIGFNAYALVTSDRPWSGAGLRIHKKGQRYSLATTVDHHAIFPQSKTVNEESAAALERELVRVGSLAEFRQKPDFAKDPEERTTLAPSLYPPYKSDGYAWGMSIDLNSCTGCNACVVACQAENNIPVVGKDQVGGGREMHWIRIDTYYQGGLENPASYHEPVLCMHCENAPCEVVCPVAATTHSPEGLNEMIYNRCVGTRYCSNNCPYKVRRFNFLLYSDWTTPSLMLLRNPNVSVRSRGVMEKCTYCVQRINAAKIEAEKQDRDVRDGEIVTACQQSCPSQAIVFGNINDPNSRVSRLKAQSRNYSLLTELNTRPRTTYLARLKNPNPDLPAQAGLKE